MSDGSDNWRMTDSVYKYPGSTAASVKVISDGNSGGTEFKVCAASDGRRLTINTLTIPDGDTLLYDMSYAGTGITYSGDAKLYLRPDGWEFYYTIIGEWNPNAQ